MDGKLKFFDGTSDIKFYLWNVSLHLFLKGYDGERAAQNLTNKLEDRAFACTCDYFQMTEKRSIKYSQGC